LFLFFFPPPHPIVCTLSGPRPADCDRLMFERGLILPFIWFFDLSLVKVPPIRDRSFFATSSTLSRHGYGSCCPICACLRFFSLFLRGMCSVQLPVFCTTPQDVVRFLHRVSDFGWGWYATPPFSSPLLVSLFG